jgi:hypothetical protein
MVLLQPVASRPRSPSFHARGPGRLGVMVLRLTLSGAAHAAVGLIVWCRGIAATKSSPDRAELAQQYGAHTTALEWRERLVCSQCQSRKIDMAVSGTERRAGPDNPKSGMRAILPQHFGTQRPQCQWPHRSCQRVRRYPYPSLGRPLNLRPG